jgi:hypothetical protein
MRWKARLVASLAGIPRPRIALAGSTLAACLISSTASGHAVERATSSLTCKTGSKPARVAGKPTCLTVGQSCSATLRAAYARAALVCHEGRLTKLPAAPKTLTTSRQSSPPGSSRAYPIPLDTPGNLGNGWTLTITSVNTDAVSAILAADAANAAPLQNFHYVLITVTATYNGPGSSHLTPATSFRAVGASNVEHTTSNSFCGDLPQPNLDLTNPLVVSGQSESGYASCWMVSTADVASLEMYYQPLLSTTQVWFALH